MNHIVPTYRQNTGTDDNAFAARPLKHWRKQYQSLLGFSRAAVGMPMDQPGGLVLASACKTCRGAFPVRVDVFTDAICTSCNPIKNKTALSDKRYTDNKAYLQARGVTYTQNEYIGLPGQLAFTTNTTTQVCTNAGSQFPTIYKPSNSQFAQQGGVSSSARLARLKYNTLNNKPVVNNGITVNGSVFNTAAGAMGLNSGLYQLQPSSDYYTKFKPQASVCYSRNGKKAYCPPFIEPIVITFQNGPPDYGTQPIAWHKINITLQSTGELIFTGYFTVNTATTVIQNFYYINNNQYVDILLPLTGNDNYDNGSDNIFVNNNFTGGGTNIQPVIPYINITYNNPSRLQFYGYFGNQNGIVYKPDAVDVYNWIDIGNLFTFTFTIIPSLVSG